MKKVCIVMGSDSDLKVMSKCIDKLKTFDIPFEVRIVSAHRTPLVAETLAKNAKNDGFGVIIAAAGKAAHLGGVIAAYTTCLLSAFLWVQALWVVWTAYFLWFRCLREFQWLVWLLMVRKMLLY